MKFIKKNKFTIVAIIIFMLLVSMGVYVRDLLVPDDGKAAYGNRLDGINNYKLTDSMFDNIESKLKEDTRVLSVTDYLHGKIINIVITLSDDVSIGDAKKIGNSVIGMFDDELEYYSLQVYLKKENPELNNFPIIGFKDTAVKELNFTHDREITVSEESTDEK